MKKKLLIALTILMLTSTFSVSYSQTQVGSDLSTAIRLYKSHNYSECYVKLDSIIKKDPSNALAYYYKAMTATQIGKKAEAIDNYEKAISLAPSNGSLIRYAQKGKRCLETPDKCKETAYDSEEDKFIRSLKGPRFSDSVRSQNDDLKIQNLKRDINRDKIITPQTFKEYKDFSSMNVTDETPSNEEIVAAMRVLQKAGLYNNGYNMSDLSILMDGDDDKYTQNAMLNMFGGSDTMNPQLIQALLTNNMTLGF